MEKGWKRVYISNQMHKVDIVRAVLSDNEIDSVAIDKRDSSYVTIGDIEVYVPEEDAILANIIIEENAL